MSGGGFFPEQPLEQAVQQEQQILLPLQDNETCSFCSSIELDFELKKYFSFLICLKCKDKEPEKFSLITKTRAKKDFLLTESELNSLKFKLKQNPLKSNWSEMKLYLNFQVEELSKEKFKDSSLLMEKERKLEKLEQRKEKKFKKKLKELRVKTRLKQVENQTYHEHDFQDSSTLKKCKTCDFKIEFEEIT